MPKQVTCKRCRKPIRAYQAWQEFLLPIPGGEVRRVCMCFDCLVAFNKLATTKEYAERFTRAEERLLMPKRRASA